MELREERGEEMSGIGSCEGFSEGPGVGSTRLANGYFSAREMSKPIWRVSHWQLLAVRREGSRRPQLKTWP